MVRIAAFSVLVFVGLQLSNSSLRSELVHQQEQTGLTLVSLYGSLSTVNFVTRSILDREIKVDDRRPGEGTVSRDGNDIAFEMLADHPFRKYLGVARLNGTALREYKDVNPNPSYLCWSYDKSKIALRGTTDQTRAASSIEAALILDLNPRTIHEVESNGYITSQCWSPDDKKIVYGIDNNIRVYDVATGQSYELTKGVLPAWSPDGLWIAFFDKDAFYAIRPTGADRKLLFKVSKLSGGPWWSPDSRMLAYLVVSDHWYNHTDFVAKQLRVRRLADNSDDWVAEQADVAVGPNYQWVELEQLNKKQ